MDESNVRDRLAQAENGLTERKPEGVKPHEIRQTLCAFANSVPPNEVGLLFVGVEDGSGRVIGIQNAEAIHKRVEEAAETCAPPITYTTRELVIEEKHVIVV